MGKDLLKLVIDQGVRDNLNTFFLDVSNAYSEIEDNLSIYDDDRFANFQTTGEIVFNSNEKLVVVTAEVLGDLTERSGKKAQYEKAKKILKDYMKYDAGIFVFSDPTGSFRFSLVYGQAEGIRKSWSNFRRFTYFVSRDQTNKTFRDRVGGCDFASLETIKDAFSVEKVTKAFYTEIANWYFWAVRNVTFPKDAETEANGRNNAVIRLITRLIFIWFMKERKLVPPDLFKQEKISALLKSIKPDETTYYKAILQNLFFATLNTQIEERKFRFAQSYHGKNKGYMEHNIYRYEDYFKNQKDMLEIFKDIPFLNGGLFDCLDWSAKESGTGAEVRFDGFSDKEVGLNVSNHLFFSGEKEADLNIDYGTKNKKYRVQGLLNILSAYNFTIDENDPNDQEVALDPELLGKVFENLLASFNPETATTARKATGSYYTPREIVDYMVTQSLKEYYKTHLSDVADIDNKLEELLSPITEEPVNPFGEIDSKRVVRLTEALRIVDPAVGSGAFPMGILNKLVSVLARADRDNRLWQEAQLKGVEGVTDPLLKQKLIKQINEQFSRKNSNYGRKLYLIQKCIYGVDIQQIAIEIAKLRFFIALLVDERIDKSKPNWGIEPLPNLDFKLMQGNSLISEFMGIDLDAEDSSSYGKLMKDETDELITQYQNKKGEYQYEPDRAKKEALKSEIDNLIARIFESKLQSQKAEYLTRLKNIERKYVDVPNIQQRNESIKKDTETLNKNYKFDLAQTEKHLKEFTSGQKVKPFFAWKLYFAEVFHEKNGFDVVIANPPYVRQEDIKEYKPLFQELGYRVFNSTSDLYTYFYELSYNILAPSRFSCFISSNKWMRAKYGEKLRNFFKTKTKIANLIDFGGHQVFDTTVDTNIMLFQKCEPQKEYKMPYVNIESDFTEANLNEYAHQKQQTIKQMELSGPAWTLADDKVLALKKKIESIGTPLKDWGVGISFGIKTGFNEAFIIDNATNGRLCKKDPKSAEILKPLLRGRDIERYSYRWAGLWLIKIESGWTNKNRGKEDPERFFKESYSVVYEYLKSMGEKKGKGKGLYKRDDQGDYWWELRDCAYYGELEKEKIIYPDISERLSFAFENGVNFLNNTAYFLNAGNKYLFAILNSLLMDFYYGQISSQLGTKAVRAFTIYIEQLPIPKIPEKAQLPFITLADQILAITRGEDYQHSPAKQARVRELERQIDQMVYELYGLTPEEIAMVEGSSDK